MLLAAACGGGGTPAAAPGAPGAANESSAPSAAGATAAPSGAVADPSFADILQSGKLASYRISYKMTTTQTGQGTPASLEQTWYFKPPNTRFDMTIDAASGGGKISMFYLETGTYMCTDSSGQASCLKLPGEAAAGQNLAFDIQSSFQDDPAAFNATSKEQRTIAGQPALCYLIAGNPVVGFSSGTFCYTRTGVPLLSEWSAGGASINMEATSFSADVPDSDFKLPAEPTSY